MRDVVIASSEADAQAAEAVRQHHAEMSGVLAGHVEALVAAVARSDAGTAGEARERLSAWCEVDLLPHAQAEERALYPAAGETVEGRLLVQAMVAEHDVIGDLVRALSSGGRDLVRDAAHASALHAVFESHLAKENDLVVPLLLRTPGVSVAALLGGMHELLGGGADDVESAGGCGSGHACSCGESDPAGHPELDARAIPHAIRHATIFGALESVPADGGLVLLAPHDPLPLLGQISDRWPGEFRVDYLETGPETWRLVLVRASGGR
jgi:uncharacterized protein (DUF2249 family)